MLLPLTKVVSVLHVIVHLFSDYLFGFLQTVLVRVNDLLFRAFSTSYLEKGPFFFSSITLALMPSKVMFTMRAYVALGVS